MPHYRVYFVARGRFVRAEDLEAPDDTAARVMAEAASGGRAVELWRAGRKIVALEAVPRRKLNPAGEG